MHFWIDKRSQACGFNGRHGVPASLASGRRRSKSMVTPVHRFQSIESATTTAAQQYRRSFQQPVSQTRGAQISQCHSPIIGNEATSGGSIISRQALATELETPVYLNPPVENAIESVPHAQLMRLGGLTKYGMWASFGLTTVSVAATKFYVDHQGTFEILLLCTLGVLSAGLLISCILTVCKRKTSQPVVNVQIPHSQPTEMEIPEVMPQREILIAPISTGISQQSTVESGRGLSQELEQPPPPYHIAILLSVKDHNCPEFPPPSYESAISRLDPKSDPLGHQPHLTTVSESKDLYGSKYTELCLTVQHLRLSKLLHHYSRLVDPQCDLHIRPAKRTKRINKAISDIYNPPKSSSLRKSSTSDNQESKKAS